MRGIVRKFSAASLIAALLFAVSGCGAGGSEAVTTGKRPEQEAAVFEMPDSSAELLEKPEGTGRKNRAEETAQKETAQKETAQADLSAYDEILERFYTMVSNPYEDYDDVPGAMGVLETARNTGESAPDMMGYLIEDISGDGVPELMAGAMPEYGAWVNAVYTLVDDKPQLVLEGWYRSQYSYGGNGIFYNTGSNGAASSCIGTFSITQDGTALECQSFYFTYSDEASGSLRVCHNTTGSWDPAESEITDLSAEDFWRMEVPASALELNPFSRFGMEEAVSVRWLEEAGTLAEYDECSIASGEDALSYIVFVPKHPVKKFTVLSLAVVDVSESGDIEYEAYPETSGQKVWIERPLVVELSFAGDLPKYGFQYEDENGDVRRFAIEISGRDGSLLVLEAERDCDGFVVRGESTTEADPARIPVLTYGRLPFDNMEEVAAGEGNPDGGYAHEYRTGDGIAVVFSRAYISRREESEEEGLTENLEDYLTGCAEGLTLYETRDTRAEKNEAYSERLGWPVYIVQFTTGWNEDTRFWTVYGTEANGYIYLYAFDIWADADWEQERVWEVFDELIFSD